MALVNVNRLSDAGGGFGSLPIPRQLSVLISISVSIALGVMVVLWSRDPNMVPLYAQLESNEVSQIIEELDKGNFKYKLSGGLSTVLVDPSELHQIRMKLAAVGLPKGKGIGYELLDESQGFGTSQFMESVKYRRSIEGELAKTISGLKSVRSARVHLGLPSKSSFFKRKQVSSASVFVDLYNNYQLDTEQIAGIVHLVASSVSGLEEQSVSIVDQHGNLLTSATATTSIKMARDELNYIKQKEQEYSRKVRDILSPVYGMNGVRAEVTLDIDFTYSEATHENFDHSNPAIVSESSTTEKRGQGFESVGIPGALSNQPPSIATTLDSIERSSDEVEDSSKKSMNYRDHKTRQYEIGKTIKHERKNVGKIKKLSVAVIVNDKVTYQPDGTPLRNPLSDDELSKVEILIKDAVGFNEERGDSVTVINSSFALPPPMPIVDMAEENQQIWQQAWFIPLVKQGVSGIFILILLFFVIRPMIKTLANFKPARSAAQENPEPEIPQPKVELPSPDVNHTAKMEHVKQIAHDDSKKAAQVVMTWMGKEDE